MKRALITIGFVSTVVVLAMLLFREPIMAAVADRLTADMFVAADTDAFDPGLAIGSDFPAISAVHEGRVVTDIRPYIGKRGLLFFANRSVEW